MRPSVRDELVRNALDVFYQNGFHATGMDMLVRETGVSKTTMYKHFRTKEDLILAALRLRDENLRNWFYRRVEHLADTPRDQLVALFDALGEWFQSDTFFGCMFIKASAEFQGPDDPIHLQGAQHKKMLKDYAQTLATNAGAERPEVLAEQLMLLKEGAIVLQAMHVEGDHAARAKGAAKSLINSAIPA